MGLTPWIEQAAWVRSSQSAPEISIVLPARNAASTLAAAVQSIRAQTFTHWELLLVEDASSDATPSIAEQLARDDDRIRVHQAPQTGLVAALNYGLALARGRFIARMDADDLSHPERLAMQRQFFNVNPAIEVVGCRVAFGGDSHRQTGYALHVDWVNGIMTPEAIRLNRFVESPLPHPSVMFRREAVERWGGYRDGLFPEDYELWLRWLERGAVMAKVPATLLTWSDPADRLSRVDPRYGPDAFYRLKAEYLARAVQTCLGDRELWIWGAGRLSRRRAELLEQRGLVIEGWIDIDPSKTRQRPGARPVILPTGIPGTDRTLVVSYVARRGARDLIRAALAARGYEEGRDFWMAA